MFKLLHGGIAFVFCLLFVSPQAHACIAASWDTIFFDVTPERLRDADVIAEVRLLTDITEESHQEKANINIVRVIKTSDARVRQGENLAVIFNSLQCSAISHKNGDEGIIIAKTGPDVAGRPTLCLYSHQDRLLKPPYASACFPDKTAATSPTRIAAEKGDVKAQITLGLIYESRKNEAEALKWFKRAAKSGDAEAQYTLGEKYLHDKNCKAAVKMFELAADQGHVHAMLKIGDIYKYGQARCLKQSNEKVIEWYTRAAERGYVWAQKELGRMYMDGYYLERNDDAEALKWLRLAAAQGDEYTVVDDYVIRNLTNMYLQGRGATKDDADKNKWLLLMAENGNVKAQLEVGYRYLKNRDVQNIEEAVKFFKLAAAQGNATAMYEIGKIYKDGGRLGYGGQDQGFERDNAEAVKWFRRAVELGQTSAQYELGRMYQTGHGVEQNYAEAVKLFRLAAARGDYAAIGQLKEMYRLGRATEDDVDEAKWYWFRDENCQGCP